jgi:hypothetical protein
MKNSTTNKKIKESKKRIILATLIILTPRTFCIRTAY